RGHLVVLGSAPPRLALQLDEHVRLLLDITRGIARDRGNPGAKRRGVAQRVQLAKRAQEHFLDDVSGIIERYARSSERMDQTGIPPIELSEGLTIPGLRRIDEHMLVRIRAIAVRAAATGSVSR